jgi:hypothetical protein
MTKHIKLFVVLALGVLALNGKAFAQDSTFHPHPVVTGQIFFDYSYQIGADTLGGGTTSRGKGYFSSTPKDFQSFDVRRIYVGVDYLFSPTVKASILIAHEPSIAPPGSGLNTAANNLLGDGTNGFYLKGANISWKNALPMSTLVVGQQGTPTFSLAEGIWGYRSVEKTILDFRGMEGSNDMGLSLAGSIDEGGNFGYTAMIGNGANQKDENNRFKKYYAELFAKFLDKKIVVEFVADADYRGARYNDDTTKTTLLKGFVALVLDPITVGLEYVGQNVVVANAKANVAPGGLSVFAHGPIMEKTLGWFARFDMFNPDANTASGASTLASGKSYSENFITAGLDWQTVAGIHIEPNLWMDMYSDKASTKIDRKPDVVGRVTFFAKM